MPPGRPDGSFLVLGLPYIQLLEVVIYAVADKILDQTHSTVDQRRIDQQRKQYCAICTHHIEYTFFPYFQAQKGRRTAFCRTAALFQLQNHAVLEDGDLAEAVLFRLGLLAAGHADDQIQQILCSLVDGLFTVCDDTGVEIHCIANS